MKKTVMMFLTARTSAKLERLVSQYGMEYKNQYSGEFRCELGEEIPEFFRRRLDHDPYHVFHPMEYVGYEDKEDHIIVAQVHYLVDPDSVDHFTRRYHIVTGKEDSDGKEVSILDLYKFLIGNEKAGVGPKAFSCEHSALVPYTEDSEVVNLRKSLYEGDTAEIKKGIRRELEEIWKLDRELRRKAVRRLYLKWHPDKNLDNTETAGEIFLFLIEQISLLDGEECNDETVAGCQRASRMHGFGEDFPRWNRTARCQREASVGEETGNPGPAFPQFNAEQKRPEEGKRWLEQSEKDFVALSNIHSADSSYAHVCFMAHQVAEKALKGGVYALCGMDGRGLTDHNLTRHAYALQTENPAARAHGLAQLCIPLENYYLKTRYPNCWPGCTDTPSDHYSQGNADQAKKQAKAVLDIVSSIMPVED